MNNDTKTRKPLDTSIRLDVNLWEVLDALPDYIAVVDSDGIIQYVNSVWYSLILHQAVGNFDFTVGHHFLSSFSAAFGTGGVNIPGIERGLKSILNGESDQVVISYPYVTDSDVYWFNTTMIPVYLSRGRRGVLIRQVDASDEKRTADALHAQNNALKALNVAAEEFLKTDGLSQHMQDMLERIGQATGMSRVYVAENHTRSDGTRSLIRHYEWVKRGTTRQMQNQDLHDRSYQELGLSRWEELLSQGSYMYGNTCSFEPNERQFFEQQGTQSVAVFPLFACDRWWGIIGFDDCQNKHTWKETELDVLQSAVGIVGGVLQHICVNNGSYVPLRPQT